MTLQKCGSSSGKTVNRRGAAKRVCAVVAAALCLLSVSESRAKTRWSSLKMVPDADFLPGGEFTVGFDGFIFKSMAISESLSIAMNLDSTFDTTRIPLDTTYFGRFSQMYFLKLGLIEWVNIELGYAGGFSAGFKARLLGETTRGMPSLAIGVHNIFNHKEVALFDYQTPKELTRDINNEFYIAFGKGFERMKMRLHGGIQTMPTLESEQFNPFFAIEKYFGWGLYTSLEMHRRNLEYHFHLFTNLRTIGDRLEITAGAVGLESLLFDENKQFSISLDPLSPNAFIGPGIWLGVRFHARTGLGHTGGFRSVEDRMDEQDTLVARLTTKIDSLRGELEGATFAVGQMTEALGSVYDKEEIKKTKKAVLEILETIRDSYKDDRFEPDSIRIATGRLKIWGKKAVVALKEILVDESMDRHIRQYSAMSLGIIGDPEASDALLDVLARTADPDLKVEILLALGKMKETRAMYLMEQLANDPNDAVAMTAQDVLRQLAQQTGAQISPELRMRDVKAGQPEVIETGKIETREDVQQQEKPKDAGTEKQQAQPQQKGQQSGTGETQ